MNSLWRFFMNLKIHQVVGGCFEEKILCSFTVLYFHAFLYIYNNSFPSMTNHVLIFRFISTSIQPNTCGAIEPYVSTERC